MNTTFNPGLLAGQYKGQTASATVVEGLGGKNAMVGGTDGIIDLQPVSIEGNKGLNIAAGVVMMELKFASITPNHSRIVAPKMKRHVDRQPTPVEKAAFSAIFFKPLRRTRVDSSSSLAQAHKGDPGMSKRKGFAYFMVVMAGSFAGGLVGSWLWACPSSALAAAGHTHMRIVKAEKFVLVGPSGEQRALMQVASNGTAYLALYDSNGSGHVELRVTSDGSGSLGFYDKNGNRRVVAGDNEAGKAGLGIFSASGRQLAGLAASPNGEVGLTLFDQQSGKARAGLGVAANGSPALALFDSSGVDRAELHLSASGKPGLALADEHGKSIAGLPQQ